MSEMIGEGRNQIRKLRKAAGLSQEELGKVLGLSQQSISRIEELQTGNISGGLLLKIADYFHVTPGTVLGADMQWEEIWDIYLRLNDKNRDKFLRIGKILSETSEDCC